VSSKIWADLCLQRIQPLRGSLGPRLVEHFALHRVDAELKSCSDEERFSLLEWIEGCTQPFLYNGLIFHYNPWSKHLILCPELLIEELQLVQSVQQAAHEIQIRKSILDLSPVDFEDFVVELLRKQRKYSRVSRSPKTRDGGKDFKAFFRDQNGDRRVIFGEVKKWNKPISESVVDRLSATMNRETTTHEPLGVIVTIHGASMLAKRTADDSNIEVWDLETLVCLVMKDGLGVSEVAFPVLDPAYWGEFDGE
jgi:hypothetical protein